MNVIRKGTVKKDEMRNVERKTDSGVAEKRKVDDKYLSVL